MKRFLCLALCVITAIFAAACDHGGSVIPTGAADETLPPAETLAPTEPAQPDVSGSAGMMAFMERFDDDPTVGDKLVYEDENLTVNVHGINYALAAGPELHLTVDNRSDKDITVQAPYAVIDDYMMTPELSIDVPAGKSANGNLYLRYSALAWADITCIHKIEFALRIVETKSYNPLFTTDLISLSTSAASEMNEYDESGQVAYDDRGVKIIFKTPFADTDPNGSPVYEYDGNTVMLVYLSNSTDRSVAVRTGSVIVNGYDMTSVMNRTVLPQKHAADTVTFYKMDLEEYGIDAVDSVKVSFVIKDAESWETIDTTDLISVKLPEKTAPSPTEV